MPESGTTYRCSRCGYAIVIYGSMRLESCRQPIGDNREECGGFYRRDLEIPSSDPLPIRPAGDVADREDHDGHDRQPNEHR